MLNHRTWWRIGFCSFALALLSLIAAQPVAAVSYSIMDLGTLPGSTTSSASDINSAGQVVGHSGGYAFLWENGVMQNLGTLPGGSSSTAHSINDVGQVVGRSGEYAFLWQNGVMQNLGTLPGGSSSTAHSINDVGQVVGSSGGRAFLWQNGTMQELATPATYGVTGATAINNLSQVAGTANWNGPCINCARTDGVIWQDGTPSTFIPQSGREERTSVSRINDAGQIVGYSYQTEPMERLAGFVRTSSGPVAGFDFSTASGINNLGQVVGNNSHGPDPLGPFLWQDGVGMQDLDTLLANGSGWSSLNPFDINDDGWIVGTGAFNSQTRAFLLTPDLGDPPAAHMPEPGTLSLLAFGAAAGARWLRRPRRPTLNAE